MAWGGTTRSEANSMTALWVIVLCGALSIVYAIWATASVLKADAGNAAHAGDRGRDPGRRAGLSQAPIHDDRHRRRRDLRAAGLLPRHAGRGRLPDRRGAVGRRRLHRHERLGARQRAHRAGARTEPAAAASTSPSSAGAITGMLVAGLALLGVAVYFAYPHPGRWATRRTTAPSSTRWSRSASAPR